MRQLWILVVPLGLVACKANPMGESGGSSTGGSWGGPGPAPDWTEKKLVKMEGEIDGLVFSIDIPEGLPREKRNKADWEDNDPRFNQIPKVFTSTIEIARIQDLKQAKYHATLDSARKTWVREQSRPDSWALTYAEPDKTRIEAITYKQATDTLFIKCKAVQATDIGTLPSYAKTRTMLENICDSLKPTGGAAKPGAGGEIAPEPVEKAPEGGEPDKAPPAAEPSGEAPSGEGRLQKAAGDKAPE